MSGGHHKHQLNVLNARLKLLGAVLLGVAVVLVAVISPLAIAAQGDEASISQGFLTSDTVESGALVSMHPHNPQTVELAHSQRADALVGVAGDKALVELTGGAKQVQIVTSGATNALVSNINGEIKTGDKITASPISGVGMRAASGVQVVGTAQADFSGIQTVERQVTDKSGTAQFVRVGLLPVQVNVTYFASPEEDRTFLPPFLQQLGNAVAGREVSSLRVLMSALVMTLGFFSIGVLLYSSVRSSIASIGRNPLSEQAVRKSLLEVGGTALGILLLTIIAIYLILRA